MLRSAYYTIDATRIQLSRVTIRRYCEAVHHSRTGSQASSTCSPNTHQHASQRHRHACPTGHYPASTSPKQHGVVGEPLRLE